jgi:hypothetical protein
MSRDPMTDAPRKPDDTRPRDPHGEFIETVKLTPEEEAARKRRNLAIAIGLVACIALIFVTTVARMTANYNSGA